MNKYIIYKDIPIPLSYATRRGTCKYPFATMQVGDCFKIDLCGLTLDQVKKRIYVSSKKFRDNTGATSSFTTQLINRNEAGVWRVK